MQIGVTMLVRDIKTILQQLIRDELKVQGKTQASFAKELGVSRQAVFQVLTDNPSVDTLIEMLGKLGVGVEVVYRDYSCS